MMQHAQPIGFQSDSALLERWFSDIATMTADVAGVSRPAYSAKETAVLDYLRNEARTLGLAASFDAGQNLVVSLPHDASAARFTLIGSHVDSVPQGGNYDGLAGVLAGLAVLVRARRGDLALARPTKLIALRGEESSWFGPCYIGSKALLGALTTEEAGAQHARDGRPLLAHMADIGVDVDRVATRTPLMPATAIEAYVELHIEQGPVLVERNIPVAVVSGIRGNLRHKRIVAFGEAGHSGAVPGAYRHDPVLAVSALLAELDAHWQRLLAREQDVAVTVGTIGTDPATSALSRIPDKIAFSLDIRSKDAKTLDEMRGWLGEAFARISEERGIRFEIDGEIYTPPALCDEDIVSRLSDAQIATGLKPYVMASGGGHDAAVFAGSGVPSGMLFVRNRNGSHNPAEAMDIDDLLEGIAVLCSFVQRKNRT